MFFNDTLSILFKQLGASSLKKASSQNRADANSTPLKVREGDLIQGVIKSKINGLTLIQLDKSAGDGKSEAQPRSGPIIKAKGNLPLPIGSRVKLRVVAKGNPLEVKLEQYSGVSQEGKTRGLIAQLSLGFDRLKTWIRQGTGGAILTPSGASVYDDSQMANQEIELLAKVFTLGQEPGPEELRSLFVKDPKELASLLRSIVIRPGLRHGPSPGPGRPSERTGPDQSKVYESGYDKGIKEDIQGQEVQSHQASANNSSYLEPNDSVEGKAGNSRFQGVSGGRNPVSALDRGGEGASPGSSTKGQGRVNAFVVGARSKGMAFQVEDGVGDSKGLGSRSIHSNLYNREAGGSGDGYAEGLLADSLKDQAGGGVNGQELKKEGGFSGALKTGAGTANKDQGLTGMSKEAAPLASSIVVEKGDVDGLVNHRGRARGKPVEVVEESGQTIHRSSQGTVRAPGKDTDQVAKVRGAQEQRQDTVGPRDNDPSQVLRRGKQEVSGLDGEQVRHSGSRSDDVSVMQAGNRQVIGKGGGFLRDFSSHLEVIHNLQSHLNAQGRELMIMPFIMGHFEAVGQWAYWKGPSDPQGIEEDQSSYHIAFELELSRLGSVNIHVLRAKAGLFIKIQCESDSVNKIKEGIGPLKERLTTTGFDVSLIDISIQQDGEQGALATLLVEGDSSGLDLII